MRTTLGKLLLFFSNSQIEDHDKIGTMRLIVANPQNPNEYSIETAKIFAINDVQKFFKTGDKALVDYSIFQQGKYSERDKAKPRFYKEIEGGQLYWAFDGSDGWNQTEVFGRYTEYNGQFDFDMLPNKVLIEPQKGDKLEISKGGILFNKKDDRIKPFWAKVVSSNNEYIKAGMFIYCQGDIALRINITKDLQYGIIDEKYILAYTWDEEKKLSGINPLAAK